MNNHINQICKASSFYIHNIRRISKYLSPECTKTLFHAFVTSRLDYCNGLVYGLPKYQISTLQRFQNTAARLITSTSRYAHITTVLFDLQWLPIAYRVNVKILVVVFKALHGIAPHILVSSLK